MPAGHAARRAGVWRRRARPRLARPAAPQRGFAGRQLRRAGGNSRIRLTSQAFADLLALLGGSGAPSVETFKNSTSALARMHNWAQVAPALTAFGVPVDADARARIVAGGARPCPPLRPAARLLPRPRRAGRLLRALAAAYAARLPRHPS